MCQATEIQGWTKLGLPLLNYRLPDLTALVTAFQPIPRCSALTLQLFSGTWCLQSLNPSWLPKGRLASSYQLPPLIWRVSVHPLPTFHLTCCGSGSSVSPTFTEGFSFCFALLFRGDLQEKEAAMSFCYQPWKSYHSSFKIIYFYHFAHPM